MTAYASIPNSDIDPESAVVVSLITALRDNPIAIAEGSSGAPNIVPAAWGACASGVIPLASIFWEASTLSTSPVKGAEYYFPYTGSIDISFEIKTTTTTAYARTYVNGVAYGPIRSNVSSTYATFSETISGLSPGDLVQIYHYSISGADAAILGRSVLRCNRAPWLPQPDMV